MRTPPITTIATSCTSAGENFVKPWSCSALTTAQPKNNAITMPSNVPSNAMITASQRIIERICRRLSPTARSSPSSFVRSWIDSVIVLAMPISAMMTARNSST